MLHQPSLSRVVPFVIGAALVAGHVWVLPRVLRAFTRAPLQVEVALPIHTTEGKLTLQPKLPEGVAPTFAVDGVPQSDTPFLRSGMRHLSWSVLYRGGFRREVGATILVGEPQTPEAPLCGARVVVRQSLLDDGTENPRTFANVLKKMANEQMSGISVPVLGALQEIRSVKIWWSAATKTDPQALRILMEAAFEKGVVPLSFWLMPKIQNGELILSQYASARVEGQGWFEKVAAFVARGDTLASKIAQEQLDISGKMVQEMLRRPPPFPLWEGTAVELAYCKEKGIEITEREAAVIPLAVVLPKAGEIPAVSLSLPLEAPPLSDAPLSLDMSVEALNGVLHLLWTKGYFERSLKELKAKEWLNEQAGERASFLTLRIKDLSLPLPPVIEPRSDGVPLSVGLEVAVGLEDRGQISSSRLFSRFGLALSGGDGGVSADLSLEDVALTCAAPPSTKAPDSGPFPVPRSPLRAEPFGELRVSLVEAFPVVLLPCYADLFAELQRHTPEFEGPLQDFLSGYLGGLLAQLRLEDPSLPVSFQIAQRSVSSWRAGATTGVRLALWGGLE